MKNIHILPTEKPSRLTLLNNERLLFSKEDCELSKTKRCVNQNIYITNSEEIKKGNWYLEEKSKFNPRKLISEEWGDGQHFKTFNQKGFRKIILTTDTDLIADGVQAIPDEFLQWYIQNPSCEFVEVELIDTFKKTNEVYVDEITSGNYYEIIKKYKIIIPKEKIINCEHCGGDGVYITADSERVECPMCEKGKIPKEEPKQETLEEIAVSRLFAIMADEYNIVKLFWKKEDADRELEVYKRDHPDALLFVEEVDVY